MGTEKKSKAVRRNKRIKVLSGRLVTLKKHINEEMEGKYSPSLIALISAACAALLMIIMLFVPNYLGVGDDGSFYRVMDAAGISYVSDAVSENSNEFFNRVYTHSALSDHSMGNEMFNSQILIVKAAVYLDDLVTGDHFFDIRILALIYGIFYIPAFYLLIKQACMRTKQFSEGIVTGFVGVFIFADVAYLTYFNSLYPEAVWLISLLYCTGAALSFQENRNFTEDFLSLVLLAVAGIVLVTSRAQCAFIGLILALYMLRLLFVRREWRWGVICVLTGLVLSTISIGSMALMEKDFNETDKFHAMTRGVLFGADDPADTLSEFGIDSSYELLADVSAYDQLPPVTAYEKIIVEEFLSRYTVQDIGRYYAGHPWKFMRMADIAIKSCFGTRRDFCGNYERSVGLPGGAKSIFWSAYSTFKNNSAPKTIGYLVILTAAACLLFGKGYTLRPGEDRRTPVLLDSMAVLLLIILQQAGVTILNSGDAAMIQHCFLVSAGMDVMTYLVFAQIAHRINIF